MYSGEVELLVLMCNKHPDVVVPCYAKEGDSGLDVQADILEPITLNPGERELIPCGVKFDIPQGYEIQVRPRSGLAHNHGISIVNAPGTVDMGYRGEIKVNLINHGQMPVTIAPAQKIAQLVVSPVIRAILRKTDTLSETQRGENGYGSTGTHHSPTR
ncbi:dUTPase [Rhizobium phage vB_RleS_L338C]|uniref:dUTPase n=1 Tax=Rhizobium phage vB_RleS_L338C TaxID=1414737 RepID=UPI0003D7AEA9|nr:dUTPase [Rhizobium phage vB_RleS_L338C]AHC30423.1 putative deoxyuridine 5'-triphosphate nucleotidohydrolase [Rhizobium phage vB_RleS_L338C]QNH72102.1 deoxyuridine 5'-triphosphate nucleotidohydrolase [Rhizobium phage P11VFA]